MGKRSKLMNKNKWTKVKLFSLANILEYNSECEIIVRSELKLLKTCLNDFCKKRKLVNVILDLFQYEIQIQFQKSNYFLQSINN